MPAIGQDTNTTFLETEILDPIKYRAMKSERLRLSDDEDAIVIPVRKEGSPHFRVLSGIKQTRQGRGENNERHNATIASLLRSLQGRRCRLLTYIFDDEGNKETLVMYDSHASYQWWSDGDTNKISFKNGGYIRPDLCGRNNANFSANKKHRSIIVEVINTHIPEHETLRHLLELSEQNYIVCFYYVTNEKGSTKYNAYDILEKYFDLRVSFFLMDGKFIKNGEEMTVYKKDASKIEWYVEIQQRFFDAPLKNKELPPKKKI